VARVERYGLDSQFDPVEHNDERGGSQNVTGIAGGDTEDELPPCSRYTAFGNSLT
jgi:hypothetical protein